MKSSKVGQHVAGRSDEEVGCVVALMSTFDHRRGIFIGREQYDSKKQAEVRAHTQGGGARTGRVDLSNQV
jgi:hypothetical protein